MQNDINSMKEIISAMDQIHSIVDTAGFILKIITCPLATKCSFIKRKSSNFGINFPLRSETFFGNVSGRGCDTENI
jgi:hypothetical protein